jgi:hypothetical protein
MYVIHHKAYSLGWSARARTGRSNEREAAHVPSRRPFRDIEIEIGIEIVHSR